jgi:hypothetical protein
MPGKRVFRINKISPGKTKALDFNDAFDTQVTYDGKKISIKL